MNIGALPLHARLGEAASFPQAVRTYETDPWSYLRRKLGDCAGPLREYKRAMYSEATDRLFADFCGSLLKPDALIDHKETFEKLLTPDAYADLSFHLDPGADPKLRFEKVAAFLARAKIKTLFDTEALPPRAPGQGVADTCRRDLSSAGARPAEGHSQPRACDRAPARLHRPPRTAQPRRVPHDHERRSRDAR